MTPTRVRRYLLTLLGGVPGLAIGAGLLSLPDASSARAEFWPWLPALVAALGIGSSALFWLVLAPRRDGQRHN